MKKTHLFREAVHFPDIDIGGGMYHGRYLDYFDKARNAMWRAQGVLLNDLIKSNYALVVVEANLKFIKPVLLGDTVFIYSRVSGYTSKAVTLEQLMSTEDLTEEELSLPVAEMSKIVHYATVTLLSADLSVKRVVPWSAALKSAIEKMIGQ